MDNSQTAAADQVALAKPTPQQAAWQDLEIGMFIHFGLETWQDKESDDETSMENLALFDPSNLDIEQWIDVTESFGAKYIILVAKHVGGFCLWQTESTEYSIKNSPYMDGKGDIVNELSSACRRRGMKIGIYIYPGSIFHGAGIGVATGRHGDPDGEVWLPNEVDTVIRDHYWFWNTHSEKDLKSLDHLMDIYYNSVGHGSVLLINIAPDRSGRIPAVDAKRAVEFGAEVKRRFGQSIAEISGVGKTVELSLDRPQTIDHVITMEEILHGERVHQYVIGGFVNWRFLILISPGM